MWYLDIYIGITNNYFAKLLLETKGFLDKRKNNITIKNEPINAEFVNIIDQSLDLIGKKNSAKSVFLDTQCLYTL